MGNTQAYNNESDLKYKIQQNKMAVLYFSSNTCGACTVIRKRIGQILEKHQQVQIYDIAEGDNRKLAASFQVFSFPLMILFIEGKETLRYGKNIDFLKFEKTITRYEDLLQD